MVNRRLEIKDICLDYGKKEILKDVSFELVSGRVLALIGPNGAGKSSSMRILADLVRPKSGTVYFNGTETSFSQLREYTGYYIEMPSFYKYLSAKQNLKLLQKIRPSGSEIDELIALVGLEQAGSKPVRKYSKGMRQRLGIAQAMIGDPDVLILDEPFDGLDPEVKQFLMDLVSNLAKEENKAVLISSHQLDDMVKIADDVVLIAEGEVKLKGDVESLLLQKQKVKFYFLNDGYKKALEVFKNIQIRDTGSFIEAILSLNETKALVQELVENGAVPYKIEHANLLHEKYLELTR